MANTHQAIPTLNDSEFMRLISPEKLPSLCAETAGSLKAAHVELLGRFAESKRNELRIEVRLFRFLLRDLITWTEYSPALDDLGHKARWWESYWYEREYGDSQFEELTEEEKQKLIEDRPGFERRHAGVWAVTLATAMLEKEVIASVHTETPKLTSLRRLSREPDWDDFYFLLSKTEQTMRGFLTDIIRRSIHATNPATYSSSFLDFLNEQKGFFEVGWMPKRSRLFVITDLGSTPKRAVSKGALSTSAKQWIARQKVSRKSDQEIGSESNKPLTELVTYIQKKIA